MPGVSRRQARAIEEIVVQARKREELLEDTPVSVTALSETALRESGVQRLDDIQILVPNLTFELFGNSTNIRIRGVGTSTTEIAFDPGVGVYVDGVYLPRSLGSLVDIVDVQQIEVLRGPQGTLFGKNTVGGAINITTVKPTEELEGFAMVRPGNFDRVDTRFMLNAPVRVGWLDDRLFARLAFASTNTPGYTFDLTRDEWLNGHNSLAFLGSLRFVPREDVTIDLTGSWSRAHNNGIAQQCVVARRDAALAPFLPPGSVEECEKATPFETRAEVAAITDLEDYGTWMVANWDVGKVPWLGDISVKSLSSWREQRPRARFDVDQTSFQIIQLSTAGGLDPRRQPRIPAPVHAGRAAQRLRARRSAQLRRRRLRVLGGRRRRRSHHLRAAARAGESPVPEPALPRAHDDRQLDVGALRPGHVRHPRLAELDRRHPVHAGQEGADLRAIRPEHGRPDRKRGRRQGLREVDAHGQHRRDRASGSARRHPPRPRHGLLHLLAGIQGRRLQRRCHRRYRPHDGDRLRLRSGDARQLRGRRQADRLRTESDAEHLFFLGKYDDIQVTQIRDTGLDENGVPTIARVTDNAAKGTTKGFEIELQGRPIDGLLATGSIGYVDAVYDSFADALSDFDGTTIDRSGDRFLFTPRLQTFVGLQYSFPMPGLEGSAMRGWFTPRLEWAYESSVEWLGPEVPQATQRGYNLLNARFSYDFLDDRAQVALWAKNLLDEAYFNNVTPIVSTVGFVTRNFAAPRTFGAELSWRF